MTRAYILHEQLVQEYRWLFPRSLVAVGPFDLTTRQLLHLKLGRELLGLTQSADAPEEQARVSAAG